MKKDFNDFISWCLYLGKEEKEFLLAQDFSEDEKDVILKEIETYISSYEENNKISSAIYLAWITSLAWLFLDMKEENIRHEEEKEINSELDNYY